MRLIKQTTSYSCGPTAVSNIYRSFSLISPSVKTIQKNLWKIKPNKAKGTRQKSYVPYFRSKDFKAFRLKKNITIAKIKKLEKKDYKILINLSWITKKGNRRGHASTLIKSTKKGMYISNAANSKKELKTKIWISNKRLEKYLWSIIAIKLKDQNK